MSRARYPCATPGNNAHVLCRSSYDVFSLLSELDTTGDTFRSYDLGIMSPARYLCATPAMGCCSDSDAVLKTANWKIPETGLEPVSSGL
jgi:hypothetical protein